VPWSRARVEPEAIEFEDRLRRPAFPLIERQRLLDAPTCARYCASSTDPAKALAYDRTRRIVGDRVPAESLRLQPSGESVGSLRNWAVAAGPLLIHQQLRFTLLLTRLPAQSVPIDVKGRRHDVDDIPGRGQATRSNL
jgi:hypothetical protein